MQEIRNNKKHMKLKWLSIVFAIAMVAAIVITSSVIGFQKPVISDLEQGQIDNVLPPEAELPVTDGEGNALDEAGVHPMPANLVFAKSAMSTAAETPPQTITLNATIKPENAGNKTVDWKAEFVNPSSAWATGKTVSDYISVTATADGSTTATVSCKAAFGEQIRITVTSRSNPRATAECKLDYLKRVTPASFYNGKFTIGQETGVTVSMDYGTGTVQGTVTYGAVTFSIPQEFQQDILSYTSQPAENMTFKTYTAQLTNGNCIVPDITSFFDVSNVPMEPYYNAFLNMTQKYIDRYNEGEKVKCYTATMPYTYTYNGKTIMEGTLSDEGDIFMIDLLEYKVEEIYIDNSTVVF